MDDSSVPRGGGNRPPRRVKTRYVEIPVILRIPVTAAELGGDDPQAFAADLVREQSATLGGVEVELSLQTPAA